MGSRQALTFIRDLPDERGAVPDTPHEFSFKSRATALRRFREETFDILIVGGGITGAACARDAASRGLTVALVERRDFAQGTSSNSSKLIHGGLRYLENLELKLVFEALKERTLLLKTAPHLVRPLLFYLPVYKSDRRGMTLLSMGMWLYDILALFRAPAFHKRLSKRKLLAAIPGLTDDGLKGGFCYFDACMWDDALTVEILRDAAARGAAVANYAEAVAPIWEGERIIGFKVRDNDGGVAGGEIAIRAKRTVICVGPWLDQIGIKLFPQWHPWLAPSKGIHLVFDLKKIPVPGAITMSHPTDGRIAFVIPRPDLGAGVAIVGTTDGPTPSNPEKAVIEPADVMYLMNLLQRYFPSLNLGLQDIISAYIGVRPLIRPEGVCGAGGQALRHGSGQALRPFGSAQGKPRSGQALQKVSREHHIDFGPGGVILVAGGKYTTHRTMAREIVDVAIRSADPIAADPSQTEAPINPAATPEAIVAFREDGTRQGWEIPDALFSRYGAEALQVLELHHAHPPPGVDDPAGFPHLAAQLRFQIRYGMVLHLEDFFLRRVPLYFARRDHGLPWADALAQVWAEELGLKPEAAKEEVAHLRNECIRRSAWTDRIT